MSAHPEQVQRAANALLKHMKRSHDEFAQKSAKQSLDADSDEDSSGQEPIWMIVTTKKHVVDKKRLKPGRIPLPHSLHTLSADSVAPTRVCLITASPQRTYKDIVASATFPAHLKATISRVIDIAKLKAKYKSFESKRQLRAQHDIFLADDRVVTMLPETLGKVFYKGGEKRPIPVELAGNSKGRTKAERDSFGFKKSKPKIEGKPSGPANIGTDQTIARSIEQALGSALVHLAPSVTTAVKVAHTGMSAANVAENVEAVIHGMVDKYVPQKWKNVRAIHIKGPNTAALPVWQTEELWVDEGDVLDEEWQPSEEQKARIEAKKAERGSKRKLLAAGEAELRDEGDVIKVVRKKRKSV